MSLNPPDRNQRSLVDGLCSSSPSPPVLWGVSSLSRDNRATSVLLLGLFLAALSPNPYFSPSAGRS